METRLKRIAPHIRKATKNDIRILAALHDESFGMARWSLAQIADGLALETTLALVAEEGKTAWGFILCQITGEDAEILTFCIAPSARRTGAGLSLLFAALEEMRQHSTRRVFLEVGADNAAALALYKKAHFRVTGQRTGYYKREGRAIDAVMMAFDLTA
jgi:[ribosomal protein S18]-alanine N-acetyltransferase